MSHISSSSIWPQDLISDLIARAERGEEARAELASHREAQLFQWSIKNHKRRYGTGQNTFTRVEGNAIVLRRKPEVKVNGEEGRP